MNRNTVIQLAVSYEGAVKGSEKHKEIVDFYNKNVKPLPRNYKVTYTDAWCATFASAIFAMAGASSIEFPFECSCTKMIEGAKSLGIWKEDDSYKPSIGDLIMYSWKDSGSGDCTLNPDHVGIVVSVGDSVKVIEGNKNNKVDYRTVSLNGRYIRGFIAPVFKEVDSSQIPKDYAKTAWYKAKDKGIMDGSNPHDGLTREQFAVCLERLGLI